MKKFTLVCLALFCMMGAINAQNAKPAAEPVSKTQATDKPVDGPKMTFEHTTVDYGEIEQSSDPLRVFPFKNEGTEPLIIKHAKGSCGCTVPNYPKEPIMPGESADIEVRYDTKRIGPFTKTVRLTTNEGGPQRVLTIKGKVHKKAAEPVAVPESAPSMFSPKN